jgi:glycosyltransferase involved in cell wall biosynthesis
LLLPGKLEGIGRFTYEVVRRLAAHHPDDHFYLLFDRVVDWPELEFDNVTPVVLGPQARHPVLFWWWFEQSVGPFLNRIHPDVFFSPDGYLSLRATCPQLAVMHDLNFLHHPEYVPWLVGKYYNHFFPRFARKATRIATVSHYSASDISASYGIAPSLIDVVGNGVNEHFTHVAESDRTQVRARFSNGLPYFLFVGSLHPRKNLEGLLSAFALFRAQHPSPVKLIVAGATYFLPASTTVMMERHPYKQDIVFTGRVSEEDLALLMGSALALTYFPHFEGFGIPILEAFACGTPVACSNTTSMPEVAGDGALLANPKDPQDMALCMQRLASDSSLRTRLMEAGTLRLQHYQWDLTAEAVYRSLLLTAKTQPHA